MYKSIIHYPCLKFHSFIIQRWNLGNKEENRDSPISKRLCTAKTKKGRTNADKENGENADEENGVSWLCWFFYLLNELLNNTALLFGSVDNKMKKKRSYTWMSVAEVAYNTS